jgi:poly(hydroxyalkanoate) depolymerase family esterase
MAEATRLTRAGKLEEATAAIQRALAGNASALRMPQRGPGAPSGKGSKARLLGAAPGKQSALPGPAGTARPTPQGRRFRGAPRLPVDLPGSASGAQAGVPVTVPAGARFVERTYAGKAGTRAYKLYVPSGYVGEAVPLVVMLHGCTQNPDDIAAGTGMNRLAEEHTFLVAYPAQARNANMQRCWNWFQAGDQQRGRGEPSLIAGITRHAMDEYRVDDSRVYLAGMSAGGAMAAVVAAAYPDLYAAAGIHSGLAPGAAHDLSGAFAAMQNGSPGKPVAPHAGIGRTVPIIVFHGDRDTTVHPSNAEYLISSYHRTDEARSRDRPGERVPRATTQEGKVPGGYAYTRTVLSGPGGSVVAEGWTVHGLGHAWSGGSPSGSYTDSRGPDASAEMLRFFREHPKRGGDSGRQQRGD